jgi:Tol biopolymer transport system component
MQRSVVGVAVVLVLAACGISGAPASVAESPSPQSSEAEPSEPTSTPEGATPTPAAWTGHPAAGLAIVGIPNEADPKEQIFVVEADGSLRQVTGVSGNLGASHPTWSPDGSQIAFGQSKLAADGVKGLVGVVNADGTGERQLAEGQGAQWSPDGSRIAFFEVDDVTGEELSMYIVDVASGEVTDLGLGNLPRWLRNDRLVFNRNSLAADGSVTAALEVMDVATGESEHLADETFAYPSPDGSAMLLVHEGVISLAGPDGSDAREIANGNSPVWSPDGTLIALDYAFDEQARPIHAIVDLEGEPIIDDIVGATPTWAPDGTRIAVEYFRPEGEPVVRVIEVASGELLWEAEGMQPAWAPAP